MTEPIVFPDVALRQMVRVAFGADLSADPTTWLYTDLSSRVMDQLISIKRGGLDEQSGQPGAAECTVVLDNEDGALSPHRPASPYFDDVRQGAPIEVGIERVADAFGRTETATWGDADTGDRWTTTGGLAANYSVSAGAGRISLSDSTTTRNAMLADVDLSDFEIYHEFTMPAVITYGTGWALLDMFTVARSTDSGNEYRFRVVFNPATGPPTVTARILSFTAGVESNVTADTGVYLSYLAGQTFGIRCQGIGETLRMKVWLLSGDEPAAWTVEGTSSAHQSGAIGIRDRLSGDVTNTYPLVMAHPVFSVVDIRFAGEVDDWRPTWAQGDPTSAVCVVRAFGVLHRLGQGGDVTKSAMRRSIDNLAPAAYWPLEDDAGSTLAASGVEGGFDLVPNLVAFGAFTDLPGSIQTPDLSVGRLSGSVAMRIGVDSWVAEGTFLSPYIPASHESVLHIHTNSPTFPYVDVHWPASAASGISVKARDATGTIIINSAETSGKAAGWEELWHHVSVRAYNVGTAAWLEWYVDGELADTDSVAAADVGEPIDVAINKYLAVMGSAAHVFLIESDVAPLAYESSYAYVGELAAERFARLCLEENIPCTIYGDTSEAMGPQPSGGIASVLAECADADAAIMLDGGANHGLEFFGSDYRSNPALHLVIDAATLGELIDIESVNDGQHVRNFWEVSREGGATQRAIEDSMTHPMSTRRVGRRDESATLNVQTDAQAFRHAGLRLAMGTVDKTRYPAVSIDLGSVPGLIDAWLRTMVTMRIRITGLDPDQHPPGPVDRVISGWQEYLGHDTWPVTINTSFLEPWQGFRLAEPTGDTDEYVGFMIPDEAFTLAAMDETQTTVRMDSEPFWSTTADNWTPAEPLDIGGEEVAVSAVANVVTDNFGRTVSSGWGTADTGQAWQRSGGAASDFSVSSNAARHLLTSANVGRLSYLLAADVEVANVDIAGTLVIDQLCTGAAISGGLVARMVDASNFYWCELMMGTDAKITLRLRAMVAGVLSTLTTTGGYVASEPLTFKHTAALEIAVRFHVRGSVLSGRAWVASGAQPWVWTATIGDDTFTAPGMVGAYSIRATGNTNTNPTARYDSVFTRNPQTITVARSINGVVSAHDAGTPIEFITPGILGP